MAGTIFDFVTNHAKEIEQLAIDGDEVRIPIDEYDFSHPDLQVDTSGDGVTFTVEVGPFKLVTTVDIDNLSDATKHLKAVNCQDKRREIIEAIEEKYRNEAESERDQAEEEMNEAKQKLDDSQKDFDNVVDALGDLKGAWSVP